MKVLIVEDDQFMASAIQRSLEKMVSEIKSAVDGIEGFWTFLHFKPDLIITDIRMPGENGLQMMSHIRRHDPMIKTIYMSGDVDTYRPFIEEEKERYQAVFFQKPFSLESLRNAVLELTSDVALPNMA